MSQDVLEFLILVMVVVGAVGWLLIAVGAIAFLYLAFYNPSSMRFIDWIPAAGAGMVLLSILIFIGVNWLNRLLDHWENERYNSYQHYDAWDVRKREAISVARSINIKQCKGCRYWHGQIYGDRFLVCALHPNGLQETCHDWEGE